jgi:hypothetical protein
MAQHDVDDHSPARQQQSEQQVLSVIEVSNHKRQPQVTMTTTRVLVFVITNTYNT